MSAKDLIDLRKLAAFAMHLKMFESFESQAKIMFVSQLVQRKLLKLASKMTFEPPTL